MDGLTETLPNPGPCCTEQNSNNHLHAIQIHTYVCGDYGSINYT